jgi:hypothetical protein
MFAMLMFGVRLQERAGSSTGAMPAKIWGMGHNHRDQPTVSVHRFDRGRAQPGTVGALDIWIHQPTALLNGTSA